MELTILEGLWLWLFLQRMIFDRFRNVSEAVTATAIFGKPGAEHTAFPVEFPVLRRLLEILK